MAAGKNNTENKRRFLIITGICAGVAIVIFVVSMMFFTPADKTPSSKTNPVRTSIADKGVVIGDKASEEYNKNLKEFDQKKADNALDAGKSYMSIPIPDSKPLVQKTIDTPPPPPPAPAPKPQPVPKQQAPKNNDLLKRTMDDFASLDARIGGMYSAGKIEYVQEIKAKPTGPEPVVSKPPSELLKAGIKPGDMLYGIITTGINSDVPSAVMASIVTGDLKGYRILGSYQRYEERLVVAFNRVVSPNGKTTQIEAYAVDPGTTEAHVASDVDTHFLSRWGALAGAAFLEGLGEAKRYAGASSYAGGGYGANTTNSDQMVWGDYSLADQAWIAAGRVGSVAGKLMEKYFDRPPTVYLDSGSEIGILVTNVQ